MPLKKLLKYFKKVFLLAISLALIIFGFNVRFFLKNISFSIDNAFRRDGPINTDGMVVIEKHNSNFLYVPTLAIEAPIIEPNGKSESFFQNALAFGVGHYPGTAKPGEFGNVYIFGHSSDVPWSNGSYKTIFALLPRIEIGAEIILTDEKGREFTYKVFDKFVAEKTDTRLLGQYNYERKIVTLQTSWPLGTALKRYMVLAELVSQ